MVSSASGTPKPLVDQAMVTVETMLNGLGGDDSLPTVVAVAHYDAGGAVPGLAYGADANGSGVTILMELARLWGHLYKVRYRAGHGPRKRHT